MDEARREREQINERRQRLEEARNIAFELRRKFIKSFPGGGKYSKEIIKLAVLALLSKYQDTKLLRSLLGIKAPKNHNDITFDNVCDLFEESPEKVLLAMAYASILNVNHSYNTWSCHFAPSKPLDCTYDCLVKIGYQMSDEERALRDGTHELYVREDK